MIRDPFDSPPMAVDFGPEKRGTSEVFGRALVMAKLPGMPPELVAALERAGLAEKLQGKTMLHATRASRPRHVLDARPVGKCVGCGQACWLSPSSVSAMKTEDLTVVCDGCVGPDVIRAIFDSTRRL